LALGGAPFCVRAAARLLSPAALAPARPPLVPVLAAALAALRAALRGGALLGPPPVAAPPGGLVARLVGPL
ncbi:DUF2520 domain-containing protein, partial [Mycobacterium tuberculosis]